MVEGAEAAEAGEVATATSSSTPDLDAMSRSGGLPGKGGQLTKAGHALDKHGGGRPGSGAFCKPSGGPSALNKAGQDALDDILTNPGSTHSPTPSGRFQVALM